jgi:hypothetical protein
MENCQKSGNRPKDILDIDELSKVNIVEKISKLYC